jgi:hypothetical protein
MPLPHLALALLVIPTVGAVPGRLSTNAPVARQTVPSLPTDDVSLPAVGHNILIKPPPPVKHVTRAAQAAPDLVRVIVLLARARVRYYAMVPVFQPTAMDRQASFLASEFVSPSLYRSPRCPGVARHPSPPSLA